MDTHRDFPRLATGSTERELLAWLRRILARNLVDNARHQNARIRTTIARYWKASEQSGLAVHEALAATATSPSAAAVRGERAVLLADALAALPDDHRQGIDPAEPGSQVQRSRGPDDRLPPR